MRTVDAVQLALAPVAEELGYELIDVEFKKEQADWVLTLYIDSPSGVSIDDCEKVSRAVDPILDELDPIEQAYFLSVSSPGLDRPLKKEADYKRNLGKMVEAKLYAQQNGCKDFIGTLDAYDNDSITLTVTQKKKVPFTVTIARKDLANIRPYLDFEQLN